MGGISKVGLSDSEFLEMEREIINFFNGNYIKIPEWDNKMFGCYGSKPIEVKRRKKVIIKAVRNDKLPKDEYDIEWIRATYNRYLQRCSVGDAHNYPYYSDAFGSYPTYSKSNPYTTSPTVNVTGVQAGSNVSINGVSVSAVGSSAEYNPDNKLTREHSRYIRKNFKRILTEGIDSTDELIVLSDAIKYDGYGNEDRETLNKIFSKLQKDDTE